MNNDMGAEGPNRSFRAKRLRSILLVLLTSAALGLAWLAWWDRVLSKREVTENAYVAGHQLQIVSQVPGTVLAVRTDDTQVVRAGQLLVQLDPADAALELDRARAELAKAVR